MTEILKNNKAIAFSKEDLQAAYNAVFRSSTREAGYYFWDFGQQINTHTLRETMVYLKNELSLLCERHLNKQLYFQSMGRFNHQHASKLHRDSAPSHSFLMLGYEPTKVDSRVYIADYSRYMADQNISIERYFGDNPQANVVDSDKIPAAYTKEIRPFPKDHYRLLLINNSKSLETPSYGIFHGAEIPQMLKGEDRVIDYMMTRLDDKDAEETYDEPAVKDFIESTKIDR